VAAFVAEQCGVAVERIGPDTRLLHDLAIDGDDAAESIAAFCR